MDSAPTYLLSYSPRRPALHAYRSPPFVPHLLTLYVLEYSTLQKPSISFVAKPLSASSAGVRLNARRAVCTKHGKTRVPRTAWPGTKPHGRQNGTRHCRVMLRGGCVRAPSQQVLATFRPKARTAPRWSLIRSTSLPFSCFLFHYSHL
jgi:hypothetical protein